VALATGRGRERALNILLTNDDGIQARGLTALRNCLAPLGRLFVVAPDREQSAASHALTLSRPLRIQRIGEGLFSVDGTPTDCVLLAVNGLLPERPDLVVSGINHGPNLGGDVTYSGTVAGAFEGAMLGIPSIAVSLASRNDHHFEAAEELLPELVRATLRHGIPDRCVLNVNFPPRSRSEIRGVKITRLGKRLYQDVMVERVDPRGKAYYWIGGAEPGWEPEENTDFAAVEAGMISVTPLILDFTDYRSIVEMEAWRLEI
jgi:5'-nucleotidase